MNTEQLVAIAPRNKLTAVAYHCALQAIAKATDEELRGVILKAIGEQAISRSQVELALE